MEIASIGLQGMKQAEGRLEKTASKLAKIGTPETDTVSLSDEMVSLLSEKNDFAINTKLVQTGDEMQKRVLDILA